MSLRSNRQGEGTVSQGSKRITAATAADVPRQHNDSTKEKGAAKQVVTCLFVRLNEIAGSERDADIVVDELAAYRRVINEVGTAFQARTQLLDASSALLLFSSETAGEAPSRQGIQAAVVLRERLEAVNRQRIAEEWIPFRIGIGVHSDTLGSGIGDDQKGPIALETSIQDAEGLSLLNRQAPFPAVFVSKNALEGLGATTGYSIQSLGEVSAPNQAKALTVFALM